MYVDHNATAPMSETVRTAVSRAMEHNWANPGSPHRLGQASAVQVEYARRQVAKLMKSEPKNVFFTSGATEANAWVLQGHACPVVASAIEHPSVLAWSDETIPVDDQGVIRLDLLEERLKAGPAVVSVMAANNESGVLQPVGDIGRMCQEFGSSFHCDATQLPSRLPVDVEADWLTVSAHKMGGPRGIGALIGRPPPETLLRGGSQERGHRSGTLNVPGIVGFGVAAQEAGEVDSAARDTLEAFCCAHGAKVVGAGAKRLPNTLSVLFSVPGDMIVAALDLRGIQASTGSACSSGATTNSHVLSAMGLEGTAVRFSFGRDADAGPVMDALGPILAEMGVPCV